MRSEGLQSWKSLLFVPGGQAKMIKKAVLLGADVVIVDLEDAVAQSEKSEARIAAAGALVTFDSATKEQIFLRVNPLGSSWFSEDLSLVASSNLGGVVLPKFESRSALQGLLGELESMGRSDVKVIVGIETVRAVHGCYELLGEGIDGVYFGAEDYIADLGGRRTEAGEEVLYARSQVAIAARLKGVAAIDQAVVAVHDEERFRSDAYQGRALGYSGKICLHPVQVKMANDMFSPSPEEIDHARRVIEAAHSGVGVLEGEMVDEVHVRMARAVLSKVSHGHSG